MDKRSKIYVAGHGGMVGSALIRRLRAEGFENLVFRTSTELDLTRQADVEEFFRAEKPDFVFLAAARVGGILANKTYRGDFIYTNLQIQNNVMHSAWTSGVKRLMFFSSSCVYPRLCPQPMKEESLWTGPLEPTNEPYAVAKLAGMSLCRAYNEQYGASFSSIVPTNLYGINDCFDPEESHVMAGLIQKFHAALKEGRARITLWGTGEVRRELMCVDDAADAALFLMRQDAGTEPVNVGMGADLTIRELAELVRNVVGYKGEVVFDASKPDGAPRKLLDVAKIHAMGWKARIPLAEGIARAYEWYVHEGH